MDQDRDESHQKQLNSNSQIVDFNSKEHNNALQLAEENKEQVPKLKPDEEDKDTEKMDQDPKESYKDGEDDKDNLNEEESKGSQLHLFSFL